MHHVKLVIASISGLLLAAPAWAGYVDLTYSGTILQVAASGLPPGIGIGTTITFNAVFDPAKAVDYTANANKSVPKVFPTLTNPNFFSNDKTVSLADDPLASLTVTAGGITFSKFDGINYGTPCGPVPLSACGTTGLGVGDLPAVEYLNGALAGVGNILINSQGYTLDADPTADILDRAASGSAFHVAGMPGDYDFVLSTGTTSSPFATRFAAGNIDPTSFRLSAVPEASAWSVLLSGCGGMLLLRWYRLGRSKMLVPGLK